VVAPGDDLPGHAAPFRWLGTPSPVAIVSTGVATHWAREVAAHLAQRGHALGVLHCLEPGSCELRSALASLSHAIVLEDHQRFGGLSAMVRHLCPQLSVTALGWPENWSGKSGCDQDLLASAGLSFAALSERIAGLVAS
jgi:transketolase